MSSSKKTKQLPPLQHLKRKQTDEEANKKYKESDVIIQKDHIFVNGDYVCKFPLEEMYRVVIPNTKIRYDIPDYAVRRLYDSGGILIETDVLCDNELAEFEKYVKDKNENKQ